MGQEQSSLVVEQASELVVGARHQAPRTRFGVSSQVLEPRVKLEGRNWLPESSQRSGTGASRGSKNKVTQEQSQW